MSSALIRARKSRRLPAAFVAPQTAGTITMQVTLSCLELAGQTVNMCTRPPRWRWPYDSSCQTSRGDLRCRWAKWPGSFPRRRGPRRRQSQSRPLAMDVRAQRHTGESQCQCPSRCGDSRNAAEALDDRRANLRRDPAFMGSASTRMRRRSWGSNATRGSGPNHQGGVCRLGWTVLHVVTYSRDVRQ